MAKNPAPILLDLLEPVAREAPELERVRRLFAARSTAAETTTGREGDAPLQVILRGPHGDEAMLPRDWEEAILRMVAEAMAGHRIELRIAATSEIGTEKLAEHLGVSRPTAAAMLDAGAVPSRLTPGGHRRVRLADVRTYLRHRERQRTSLAALVAHGEAAGLPLETPSALRGSCSDRDADTQAGED